LASARELRVRRARPVIALAAVAFAVGVIFGSANHSSAAVDLAGRFVSAWSRSDYATMYEEIDSSSQRALSPGAFASAYEAAARTATATRIALAGSPESTGNGGVVVPVRVSTRLFGTLHSSVRLRVVSGAQGQRIAWSRTLLFPGLRPGETLSRNTTLPARAALLADDGSVLAAGPATSAGTRESPLGAAAAGVVGEVGPLPSSRASELEAQGVPSDAIVGVSGLEAALDDRLRGTPGGQLLAGDRVLASVSAKAAPPMRTSIAPSIQRAAAIALGGQLGGVVALDPSSGRVLAVAGLGIDDLQPPGSTFKMVTLSGVLAAGIANEHTSFPYATYATLDGTKLENANGESCGGSLALAFAVSCNSVFAPLGVKLGAQRLVSTAEQLGFNRPPGLPGAVESTIPSASQIQGELALGSSAIGQGQVQASALQMAVVAATIADGGRRPSPTFSAESSATPIAAVDPSVAKVVEKLMIGVVREGTGTAAAIGGVVVAGKTGTAELGLPRCQGKGEQGAGKSEKGSSGEEANGAGPGGEQGKGASQGECSTGSNDPNNTDAWFAAFAPAPRPKIAVGVMLVKDGAGGESAAPVARRVLEAGLR
jgi:cell division protein FtsI/penicillin-binding protein 2